MTTWIVIDYDRHDVRSFPEPDPHYIHGIARRAHIVEAEYDSDAIRLVAQSEGPGFYATMPLPELRPREVTLEVESAVEME